MSQPNSVDGLVSQVEQLSGQVVADCYQCGCCTSGCPVGQAMDPPPSKAIRLLQLGKARELLESDGIWMCASCMVCGTRCPRGVDYALIAEACRAIKIRARQSRVGPETVTQEDCEEIPQQAFMASFRKFSG
jgi:heterodisulfide reductase subunit C2